MSKPLFDIDELFEKKIAAALPKNTGNEFALCGPEATISEKFGQLKPNSTIHFVTGGAWALHDLVHFCTLQTGPANLIGFSWSLTTPAAAKLTHLKLVGKIISMSYIFDVGMNKWDRGALGQLKKNSEKVITTMIHAKGFILWNDNWKISVISSANFSNNPRIEAGTLSTEYEIFDFHKKWIIRTLETGETFIPPPDSEIPGIELPPDSPTGKAVFILRGLPGSGKSTIAQTIADIVCENEEFFTNQGKYNFSSDAVHLAESYSQTKFKEAIESGISRIAVANVFADPESYRFYMDVARRHGYRVFVMIVQNTGAKNVHAVPEPDINKMKKKFKVVL